MIAYPLGYIYIDGDYNYNDKVWKQLEIIQSNPIGRILLTHIHINPKEMKIVPTDTRGSYTDWDDEDDARPNLPDTYKGEYDDLATRKVDERFLTTGRKGTGKGTNVTIKYSPEKYTNSHENTADEGLFHEMVHGLRMMLGRFHPIPTSKDYANCENEEEWLAILLTNVYTSAKPSRRLRDYVHRSWQTLQKKEWYTSAGLLTDDYHLTLLNLYNVVHRDLFWEIAIVPAEFNPMRELLILNPKKYIGRKLAPLVVSPPGWPSGPGTRGG